MRRAAEQIFVALLLLLSASPASARGPLVLAAASLQESLTEAASAWTARGHERPVLSFAATSVLARQIEAGAPAELFISADEAWMDVVESRGLVRRGTRAAFLGNRLVLVVPAGQRIAFRMTPGFPLAAALGDKPLAMADPASVPAGRYGRAALERMGVWNSVSGRVVRADNVRSALSLVEHGEAAAGIVYATDALASRKVRVAGLFPAGSHPPIRYPIALLRSATSPDAEPFRRFLLSRTGLAVFRRFGFSTGG